MTDDGTDEPPRRAATLAVSGPTLAFSVAYPPSRPADVPGGYAIVLFVVAGTARVATRGPTDDTSVGTSLAEPGGPPGLEHDAFGEAAEEPGPSGTGGLDLDCGAVDPVDDPVCGPAE